MRVYSRRFAEDPTTAPVAAAPDPAADDIDVHVKPSTAMSGLMLWVAAGVLTHIAIRIVDGWLDKKGGA